MDRRAYSDLVLSGESITVPEPPSERGPKAAGIIFGIASAVGAVALAAVALRPIGSWA